MSGSWHASVIAATSAPVGSRRRISSSASSGAGNGMAGTPVTLASFADGRSPPGEGQEALLQKRTALQALPGGRQAAGRGRAGREGGQAPVRRRRAEASRQGRP